MPDRHRLSEHQARAHARAWLAQQHTDAHELLVTLLHYVPEPDRTGALSQPAPVCHRQGPQGVRWHCAGYPLLGAAHRGGGPGGA